MLQLSPPGEGMNKWQLEVNMLDGIFENLTNIKMASMTILQLGVYCII